VVVPGKSECAGGAVGISRTMHIWFLIAFLWDVFVGIILACLGMGPSSVLGCIYGTKSGGGGCFCVRVQKGMLGYVFVVRLERIISQQIEIHAAGI